MSALLEIRGLRKNFGERTVIDIDEFRMARGESCVIAGSNGSGKTTLLRIISGLEPAHISEYRFDGRRETLSPYPDRLRHAIVYVHQHPYLFHTTLRHNLEYGLKCRGLPAPERARRVAEALEWSGLTECLQTPPAKLSGGEKQRAALARARVLEPDLLLLDEPTANLDQTARQHTIELISRLAGGRTSVLIACHDQELIRLPGMRVMRLEDGRLTRSNGAL